MDVRTRVSIRPSSNDLWFFSYLPLSISDGIATPLIPLLALVHFRAQPIVVILIIAASGISQVPFTILWGNLSDRISHRKFFLVGSFLATGVALILIALANDIFSYFWLNVLEGLAAAASAPIGTMLLLETRHKRWWPQDIGLFELISGIGTTAGLGLGFVWLFAFGPGSASSILIRALTSLLIVAGILALLSSILAWVWIEEPLHRIERRTVAELLNLQRGVVERFRGVRRRVTSILELTRAPAEPLPGREWLFLVSLAIMSVGFFLFYGPFPVYLVQVAQLKDSQVFIVYLASSAASTVLFFPSGKAVEWHSPKLVFLGSLVGRFALIPLFLPVVFTVAFGTGSVALVGWLALLNALMGVTWAFMSTASTLFLVRLAGRASRGRALGLYNAIAGFGGLIGTIAGALLYSAFGVYLTYVAAAIVVLIGAALLAPIPYHMFAVSSTAHRRRFGTTRAVSPRVLPRRGALRPAKENRRR
ncbi:MAG: MFS transporter [Thermoplasmata archaeon]|nr:MFS transporter [Thermoplasmata archaeon]